jgi:tRNA nucleotidyltransferase (CCA-adding enzyme)
MTVPHWEHFEHEADMGVRGFGHSLAQSFEQAALAMTAIITDPSCIEPRQSVEVQCRETDPALLLADWLNAIIFEMATRHMLFSEFKVSVDAEGLYGLLRGESIDRDRHQPAVEIKGATFTELAVRQQQDHWLAQCVVDV